MKKSNKFKRKLKQLQKKKYLAKKQLLHPQFYKNIKKDKPILIVKSNGRLRPYVMLF